MSSKQNDIVPLFLTNISICNKIVHKLGDKMAATPKFSANINTFNACADRYVLDGYGNRLDTEQLIEASRKVPGLSGIELVGKWHVNDENLPAIKQQVQAAGLEVTCVTPDIWASDTWGKGSFSSHDRAVREEAVETVKRSMEWAKRLDCTIVDLWFGQDGYDYPFSADYTAQWERIIECTRECADHLPEVNLVIEYKPKEPRTHCTISTVGKTILLCEKVGRANVGAMVDVGHVLIAYENPAESVALLQHFGERLMYMHFNDNWRHWDDDMTAGSVHTIELLELLYWLDRIGYNGWFALDIFPYREDGVKAASESIAWIEGLFNLLDKIGRDNVAEVIANSDAMGASHLIREAMLG
jgi:xylose isomerase